MVGKILQSPVSGLDCVPVLEVKRKDNVHARVADIFDHLRQRRNVLIFHAALINAQEKLADAVRTCP